MEVFWNAGQPLSNLPQWPRVALIEKTSVTHRARVENRLPQQQVKEPLDVPGSSDFCDKCGAKLVTEDLDPAARVGTVISSVSGIDVAEVGKHLDKSIQFLKVSDLKSTAFLY